METWQQNLHIFDFEVLAHDWIVVLLHKVTKEITVFHNDPIGVQDFMAQENLRIAGFNNKHYDQWIMQGVLNGFEPEMVKYINDVIIKDGVEGWDIPELQGNRVYFNQYDLMDDCQVGMSLKAIEAHLGMDITESSIPFDKQEPLTEAELQELIDYCIADVKATDKLDDLRFDYLQNKVRLGSEKGIPADRALYMTNAKLTAAYLDARQPKSPRTDEREYQYPDCLKREYIPNEVFEFFDRLHNPDIPDEEVFSSSLEIQVGGCPCTIAYGGIHGAIPTYMEEESETRIIRNQDVASYYPNLMRRRGYTSRNIPDPKIYSDTIDRRVQAKKTDKALANALKLVLNTTYGAMLNRFNPLYDALMGRSVCITGQLLLLEMSEHLVQECPTLKVVQLNTDGIMVSLDKSDEAKYLEITQEWQDRTGFTLEEDKIRKIVQKDVNNYIEIPEDGKPKIKGGILVRGIAPAGAFNVNNNAPVVARAVRDYFVTGTEAKETIYAATDIHDFQLIAKASHKYGDCLHEVYGQMLVVQRCNRVYASKNWRDGTLYKVNLQTGTPNKIAGLPRNCMVDNDNHCSLEDVDRDWYVRLANRYIRDFLGIPDAKRNTRKVNKIKKEILSLL